MNHKIIPYLLTALLLIMMMFGCSNHGVTPFGTFLAPITPAIYTLSTNITDFDTSDSFTSWRTTKNSTTLGSNIWIQGKVGNALKLEYKLYDGGYCNAAYGENTRLDWTNGNPHNLRIDARGYAGICFWVKGSGNKMRVNVFTRGNYYGEITNIGVATNYSTGALWPANLYNWDSYGREITTPSDWTLCFLKFGVDFTRRWYDSRPQVFDLSQITTFEFQASSAISGEEGWFAIDEVYLYKEE